MLYVTRFHSLSASGVCAAFLRLNDVHGLCLSKDMEGAHAAHMLQLKDFVQSMLIFPLIF